MREATGDGQEIIAFMLSVLRDSNASNRDRFDAARWLTERGWGRAVDSSEPVSYSSPMDELLGNPAFDY